MLDLKNNAGGRAETAGNADQKFIADLVVQ